MCVYVCLCVFVSVSVSVSVSMCACTYACNNSVLLVCLFIGSGAEPDAKKSAEIFTDLALKGHPFAQVHHP